MKFKQHLVFMVLLTIIGQSLFAEKNFEERLRKADSYRLFQDRGFSFQYTLTDAGEKSVMTVYLKDSNRSTVLSVYTEPAQLAGRRILVAGNTFWMLDKNMREPIRISSRQMLFGQASAGDLTRLTFSDNYLIESGSKSDTSIILVLNAKIGAEVSYPKIILELRSDDSRPIKAELYAATGTHMMTIYYQRYGRIDGRVLLIAFKIINERNNAESLVELSRFSSQTVDDRFFTREGMRALR